jgi:hypothetical protein
MASELIDVTAVEVRYHRVLRLTFENGEVRDIDLAPMLWGPAFESLADDAVFNQVKIDPEGGTITWPNGADISAHTLYRESNPADLPQAG